MNLGDGDEVDYRGSGEGARLLLREAAGRRGHVPGERVPRRRRRQKGNREDLEGVGGNEAVILLSILKIIS